MFFRQNQVDLSSITAQVFLNPVRLEASHQAVYKEHQLLTTSVATRGRMIAKGVLSELEQRFKESQDGCDDFEHVLFRCSSIPSTTLNELITFREQEATVLENEVRKALDGVFEMNEQWKIQQEAKQKNKVETAGKPKRAPKQPPKEPTAPAPRKAKLLKQPLDPRSIYERWEQDKHDDPETKSTLIK